MTDAIEASGGDVTLVKVNFMLHGFDNENRKQDHFELIGEFLLDHLGN